MIYLPRSAGALVPICARETMRYSMDGVRITVHPDGLWQLDATDGKMLAILRGPSDPTPWDLQQAAKALEDVEDLRTQVVVPTGPFKDAIRQVPKGRRLGVRLGQLGVALVAGEATLRTECMEARYPDVLAVVPKKPALMALRVNPELLIDLLKVCAAVSSGEGREAPEVTLHFFGKDAPMCLTTTGREGTALDCLLMPLS